MSRKNRRVVISLSNFLNDHRSTVLIYLSRRIRCIRDLEEHVGGLFGITDFYFTSGNRYLPSTEDIRILHPEELLKAIPKAQRQKGPQLKPAEAGGAFNCLEPQQKAHGAEEPVGVVNDLFNILESNKIAKPRRDTKLEEVPSTWNYSEPRRDFSLETPKLACDENKASQGSAEAERGPFSFPVSPQASVNFEGQACGAPQSPSTALVEHVFEFLERPEMAAHGENEASSNQEREQPRLDKVECTPQPRLELDGGDETLHLKKNATSSSKIDKQSKKNETESRSIDILESYAFAQTWARLDKTEAETQNSKEKVTNKRKTVRKEEEAQNSFKIRPVTVKKRKTDLICLDLPKQTNIVKSLIVSDTPKRLHDQSKLEAKREFQSVARNAFSATESQRKLEVNQSPSCNAISATTLQALGSQSELEVKPEFQSVARNAISATTSQSIESQRKLEVNQSPSCNPISATTLQTLGGQSKLEVKSEFRSPARNDISATTSQTPDRQLKLEMKWVKNRGFKINPVIVRKCETDLICVDLPKQEVNQSPPCNAISANTLRTLGSQSKLEMKSGFQSPARSAISTTDRQLKPEFQSTTGDAISASPLRTTDGQSKFEVTPAFPSSAAPKSDATCAIGKELSADQNQSAKHILESVEVESVDKKQLLSACANQTDVDQTVVSGETPTINQEEKESESSSVLLSNSDSDRRSSENKRKRKRHRKRKAKDDKVIPQLAVNSVYSFKPPSTIAAPSMHIRFDEPDVDADEAGPLEHVAPSKETMMEERQAETNGVSEEISDLEGEMLERVVRQSPRMTKTLPRAGDVVSFKFLRLNVNYEPELSKTVIGKVLDFTADTDQVRMQLISGVDQCQEPDGKFSLEDEAPTVITERSFPWKSLLESRLLFP